VLGTGGFREIKVSGGNETADQRIRPGLVAVPLGRRQYLNKEEKW
jgi:hypothetical protein